MDVFILIFPLVKKKKKTSEIFAMRACQSFISVLLPGRKNEAEADAKSS